jgi:hypothetical protein
VDLVLLHGQTPLDWEKDALAGANKTEQPGLPNQIIRLAQFRAGAYDLYSFRVQTHF